MNNIAREKALDALEFGTGIVCNNTEKKQNDLIEHTIRECAKLADEWHTQKNNVYPTPSSYILEQFRVK